MGHLNIIVIILLILGIILIILSLFQKEKKKSDHNTVGASSEEYSRIKEALDEANKAIKDLNELHEYMMGELNKKQKELMLIYDIIDEKEKNISRPAPERQVAVKSSNIEQVNEGHTTRDKIRSMSNAGMNVEEIAQQLNIGKGEVKLLLSLISKE